MQSIGALFDVLLSVTLVLGIEDMGLRKFTGLDVTTEFDFAGTVGRSLEREALVRNLDMCIQKLTDSQTCSIDGLDLIENAAAGVLKGSARVD